MAALRKSHGRRESKKYYFRAGKSRGSGEFPKRRDKTAEKYKHEHGSLQGMPCGCIAGHGMAGRTDGAHGRGG